MAFLSDRERCIGVKIYGAIRIVGDVVSIRGVTRMVVEFENT